MLLNPNILSVIAMSLVHLQVGHVQQVSLVSDKTHKMRTISLKPLLFGKCTIVFGYTLLFKNK